MGGGEQLAKFSLANPHAVCSLCIGTQICTIVKSSMLGAIVLVATNLEA